jgi:thiopurine S-methyltransferase
MWQNRQTDEFHQTSVNKYLARFWPALDMVKGNRVFVPLCGKSLDMIWLAAQGCQVIGVELSPVAVAAFFKENRLQPVTKQVGPFTHWQAGNISILCGDYFYLQQSDLGHIDTVYDRAALTALPEAVRRQYVTHLHRLIDDSSNVFLLTIEDDLEDSQLPAEQQIDAELTTLYEDRFDIQLAFVESLVEGNERSQYKVYKLMARLMCN